MQKRKSKAQEIASEGLPMKNLIKTISCISAIWFILTLAANAQTATPCPSGLVCISPDAARKALTDSDTVKADAIEKAALLKAIEDLKKELSDIKITLAQYAGENMQLKSSAVRMDAIVDSFLRNQKARNKFGVIVF